MFKPQHNLPGIAPGNVPRGRATLSVLLAALLLAFPGVARAQQFVVDDAPIVDAGACQLEAWHGRLAGWALPACQLISNLEVTAGVGWLRDFDNGWDVDYVVQGKYSLRELEPSGVGVSLVVGAGLGPRAQAMGRSFHEFFAYVPVSVSTLDDRFLLHLNAGWTMEREPHGDHDHTHHHFLWGGRGDVAVTHRFTLIGEVFGEGRETPEFQVGLRTTLIPDRLLMDVSYGDQLRDRVDENRIGLVVGLAWTPPPFF
jgi:hypothetical protein